nr:hypothetical protein [uncultured Sellimonas sp.]
MKEAFDQIHADEELKERTKQFLAEKTDGYRKKKVRSYRTWIPAAACLVIFLIAGGYWSFFLPTAAIQIEVNPSLEMEVNRFGRVLSLEGKNEDGEKLAGELNLRFLSYDEAVDRILENDQIAALLNQNEILSLVVIGENKQSQDIMAFVEELEQTQHNIDCCHATESEAHEAEEAGLGYGKYRAYLELKKLDPDVTTEEAANMTMSELYERIRELEASSGTQTDTQTSTGTETGGGGGHHHHGHRNDE